MLIRRDRQRSLVDGAGEALLRADGIVGERAVGHRGPAEAERLGAHGALVAGIGAGAVGRDRSGGFEDASDARVRADRHAMAAGARGPLGQRCGAHPGQREHQWRRHRRTPVRDRNRGDDGAPRAGQPDHQRGQAGDKGVRPQCPIEAGLAGVQPRGHQIAVPEGHHLAHRPAELGREAAQLGRRLPHLAAVTARQPPGGDGEQEPRQHHRHTRQSGPRAHHGQGAEQQRRREERAELVHRGVRVILLQRLGVRHRGRGQCPRPGPSQHRRALASERVVKREPHLREQPERDVVRQPGLTPRGQRPQSCGQQRQRPERKHPFRLAAQHRHHRHRPRADRHRRAQMRQHVARHRPGVRHATPAHRCPERPRGQQARTPMPISRVRCVDHSGAHRPSTPARSAREASTIAAHQPPAASNSSGPPNSTTRPPSSTSTRSACRTVDNRCAITTIVT